MDKQGETMESERLKVGELARRASLWGIGRKAKAPDDFHRVLSTDLLSEGLTSRRSAAVLVNTRYTAKSGVCRWQRRQIARSVINSINSSGLDIAFNSAVEMKTSSAFSLLKTMG